MSRALRLVLTFATALSAWLWVGVAGAASFEAPRCDERAATTFAEPPTMQPLFRSLQIFVESDDCMQQDAADVCDAASHGSAPAPSAGSRMHAEMVLPALTHLIILDAVSAGRLGAPTATLDAASGHVGLLERPPR